MIAHLNHRVERDNKQRESFNRVTTSRPGRLALKEHASPPHLISSNLQSALNNLLNPSLIQNLDSKNLIINLLKLATIPFSEDAPKHQTVDCGRIALSQLCIGHLLELGRVFVFRLPLGSGEFFVDGEDVALLGGRGMDIDGAVLGFFGMRENPGYGGPNIGDVGRAEGARATVVDDGFLLGNVEANEAGRETYR